jgi:hypothetical protein
MTHATAAPIVHPHVVLRYEVGPDFVTRRAPHRAAHLAYAADYRAQGLLVLGGALGDPVSGSLLVFRTGDRAVAEEFAARDPYVVAGLVERWTVEPWAVVIH